MFDIAKRARHASANQIIQIYGRPLDGSDKRTAGAFAAAIAAQSQPEAL
jgi:hypothetical protein